MHPRKKVSLLRVNGFCFPESIRLLNGSFACARDLTLFFFYFTFLEENHTCQV